MEYEESERTGGRGPTRPVAWAFYRTPHFPAQPSTQASPACAPVVPTYFNDFSTWSEETDVK